MAQSLPSVRYVPSTVLKANGNMTNRRENTANILKISALRASSKDEKFAGIPKSFGLVCYIPV